MNLEQNQYLRAKGRGMCCLLLLAAIAMSALIGACNNNSVDLMTLNLSYPAITGTPSTALTATSPTWSSTPAGTVAYAIDPDLPAGLNMEPGTGIITGTPTVATEGEYTITAVFTSSGTKTEKTATISITITTVVLTDADKVAADKADLDITSAVGGELTAVKLDFNLPTTGQKGTAISWEVISGTAIALSGTSGESAAVTRPGISETDDTVVLKASITMGTESDTKDFTLTVKKQEDLTDEQAVDQDKSDLSVNSFQFAPLDVYNHVTQDFTLPTTGGEGSTISWTITSGTAIILSGTNNEMAAVTRPNHADGDAEVILEAAIVKNSASNTKTFTLTVKKEEYLTDEQAVDQDKSDLSVDSFQFAPLDVYNHVTQDFTLPTTGGEGSTISWTITSGTAIILSGTNNEMAAVTRPDHADGDAEVILEAAIAKNSASDTKTFTLTVIKKDTDYYMGDLSANWYWYIDMDDLFSKIHLYNTHIDPIKATSSYQVYMPVSFPIPTRASVSKQVWESLRDTAMKNTSLYVFKNTDPMFPEGFADESNVRSMIETFVSEAQNGIRPVVSVTSVASATTTDLSQLINTNLYSYMATADNELLQLGAEEGVSVAVILAAMNYDGSGGVSYFAKEDQFSGGKWDTLEIALQGSNIGDSTIAIQTSRAPEEYLTGIVEQGRIEFHILPDLDVVLKAVPSAGMQTANWNFVERQEGDKAYLNPGELSEEHRTSISVTFIDESIVLADELTHYNSLGFGNDIDRLYNKEREVVKSYTYHDNFQSDQWYRFKPGTRMAEMFYNNGYITGGSKYLVVIPPIIPEGVVLTQLDPIGMSFAGCGSYSYGAQYPEFVEPVNSTSFIDVYCIDVVSDSSTPSGYVLQDKRKSPNAIIPSISNTHPDTHNDLKEVQIFFSTHGLSAVGSFISVGSEKLYFDVSGAVTTDRSQSVDNQVYGYIPATVEIRAFVVNGLDTYFVYRFSNYEAPFSDVSVAAEPYPF